MEGATETARLASLIALCVIAVLVSFIRYFIYGKHLWK